ncbi:MAG TPA: amidohydrolase family protein [Pirellulales bacterium]|jgi:N-acetylglucosamine-6-phosphate deacetylase|nr:amidohydrolase family protein [Pirellulales bacterium]
MRLIGKRYDNAELVELTIDGDRVARTKPLPAANGAADAPWVAPGFVDIQANGYGGQEFSALEITPEAVARIVRQHYAFGVTGFCPTLTTQSFEVLAHGMRMIAEATRRWDDVRRAVWGIHLEGPYFSKEDGARGAHPVEHCRRPDWDEFQRLQEAAGGLIAILTMSPEFDDAPEFISRATAAGVTIAIGHTGANSAQIKAAVDAGARLSTHLGNGAHRILRRHPNYLWDQMAEDRLVASLIVDGHHLPPEVVKSIVRAKTPERCILVSDVSGLAGLPAGRYTSSGCELEILADGRLVIAGQDQLLAGASLPIGTGVANVMRFAGVDLRTAVDMASLHPARLLRRTCGGLRPGDPADLVLFRHVDGPMPRIDVVTTVLGGQTVFHVEPSVAA